MDFLDFDDHSLYFDEPLTKQQDSMLRQASEQYPDPEAERMLDGLYAQMPESLIVLVALYRFYYYQHRYEEALEIAERAMAVAAKMMGLTISWARLNAQYLGQGAFVSMGLIRFYMLALKGSAYLMMRLGLIEQALPRLSKIVELDPSDQFGAAFLLKMAQKEEVNMKVEEHDNIESLFRR
jgi:tetratricopeptide (TPR) repeat protein